MKDKKAKTDLSDLQRWEYRNKFIEKINKIAPEIPEDLFDNILPEYKRYLREIRKEGIQIFLGEEASVGHYAFYLAAITCNIIRNPGDDSPDRKYRIVVLLLEWLKKHNLNEDWILEYAIYNGLGYWNKNSRTSDKSFKIRDLSDLKEEAEKSSISIGKVISYTPLTFERLQPRNICVPVSWVFKTESRNEALQRAKKEFEIKANEFFDQIQTQAEKRQLHLKPKGTYKDRSENFDRYRHFAWLVLHYIKRPHLTAREIAKEYKVTEGDVFKEMKNSRDLIGYQPARIQDGRPKKAPK